MKKVKKHIANIVLSGLIMIFLLSCNRGNEKYEEQEKEEIAAFLADNPNLAFELKPSGLYYYEILTGTGDLAETHDTAYIMYTCKFLNGTVFYSNVGTTDTLKIEGVNEGWAIPGFDEGITYMREEGHSMLLVPSSLAYGSTGYFDYYTYTTIIPGYTPLLYDLELVRVTGP